MMWSESAAARLCAFCASLAATAFAVSCKTVYVDPDGADVAVSPDRINTQDWTALANAISTKLVVSGVLSGYARDGRPAGLLLNPVQNQTGESIDPEAITKLVRIQLLETGRVQVITGSSMGMAAEDPIVAKAQQRKRLAAGLEDPLADVPELSARLRLFRDQVRVDGKTQTAYFLQMTLSDTSMQRAVWEGQASLMKRGSRTTIGMD
jgi:hypothetical protein